MLARAGRARRTSPPSRPSSPRRVPVAQDVTAEADSGGHTDNRPADHAAADACSPCATGCRRSTATTQPLRVGAAGGIATPASVAGGVRDGGGLRRDRLGQPGVRRVGLARTPCARCSPQAEQADVIMAPAADMFEMGVKVQVLKRGTMFAMRAAKLYELYRSLRQPGGDARRRARRAGEEPVPRPARRDLGSRRATSSGSATRRRSSGPSATRSTGWPWCSAGIWASRRAGPTPASRRGKLDYQVWCGPAMGAFNEWAKGSFLEQPAQPPGRDGGPEPAVRGGRADCGCTCCAARACALDRAEWSPA